MNERIVNFANRRLPLDQTLQRIWKKNFHGRVIDDKTLRYYLWQDVMRATKRYFLPPFRTLPKKTYMWEEIEEVEEPKPNEMNLLQYTAFLLESEISAISLDFEHQPKVNDLVVIIDENCRIAIGALGVCRSTDSRPDSFSYNERGNIEVDVAVSSAVTTVYGCSGHIIKAIATSSKGEKIRLGDTIIVKDIRNAYGQYHDLENPANWRRGKCKVPLHNLDEVMVYSTEPEECPTEQIKELIKLGKKYVVLDMHKKDVYFDTPQGIIRYPLKGVEKVGQSVVGSEEQIRGDLKDAIIDFYLRKRVFQQYTAIRKMLIAEARAGKTEDKHVQRMLENYKIYSKNMFNGWNEVMQRVSR